MNTYFVNALPREIRLGKQTENGVEIIRFDCSPWIKQWPGMKCAAWVTAPGSGTAYPADAKMDGDVLVWAVSSADTAIAGNGMIEIVGMADEKKKLSKTINTRIVRSSTATPGDPPDPAKPWVDKVLDAALRAEEAAERAEEAGGNVDESQVAEIVEQYLGKNPPAPGFSPSISVEKIENGHRVFITDEDGVEVFDVEDGKDGSSVTIESVSESAEDGGNNTVTFSDGKVLNVKNGRKGDPGYTPVKGRDYYTEADKSEMVSSVIAALPVYNGEVSDA